MVKTALSFNPLALITKSFSAVKNFLGSIDWSGSGAAIIGSLVSGIKSMAMKPFEVVGGIFAKVKGLFGGSKDEMPALKPVPPSRMTDLPGRGGQAGNAKGGIVIHYAPTIQVSGQPPAGVRRDVESALGVSEQRLKKLIAEVLNGNRRLSYA